MLIPEGFPLGGKGSESVMTIHPNNHSGARFEIRFESLHRPGMGMAFASHTHDGVDVDALPQRARSNYPFCSSHGRA